MAKLSFYAALGLLFISVATQAQPIADQAQLSVWSNEAIVATYTYDYKNFMSRQRDIAKYFSATGWTAYSKALNDSKLPEDVQKNSYVVSAVATLPPEIKTLADNRWQATMPLLVLYKNPQFQQLQTLEVTINFSQAPSGQGVRGLAIDSLESTIVKPACLCQTPSAGEPANSGDSKQPPNAK